MNLHRHSAFPQTLIFFFFPLKQDFVVAGTHHRHQMYAYVADKMQSSWSKVGGSITVPLTSCLTGLESAVWQLTKFVFYFQNRLIQISQTGGQQYSDTSPFSIPWVYPRQTWNFRSHAVSACICLWCHEPMHACTAFIAPWHHRPMHAVTSCPPLFQFCLRYTFTSSYFW